MSELRVNKPSSVQREQNICRYCPNFGTLTQSSDIEVFLKKSVLVVSNYHFWWFVVSDPDPYQKKFNFVFSCYFFFNFWSLKPWIRIGSGSVSGSVKNEYGSETLLVLSVMHRLATLKQWKTNSLTPKKCFRIWVGDLLLTLTRCWYIYFMFFG